MPWFRRKSDDPRFYLEPHTTTIDTPHILAIDLGKFNSDSNCGRFVSATATAGPADGVSATVVGDDREQPPARAGHTTRATR